MMMLSKAYKRRSHEDGILQRRIIIVILVLLQMSGESFTSMDNTEIHDNDQNI